MAKPLIRISAIQFGFLLVILGIIARAAQLQLVQGDRWAEQARRQRTERAPIAGVSNIAAFAVPVKARE